MTAFAEALDAAARIPRLFVPFSEWLAGVEPPRHRLYLGAHGVAWDECHKRQICDRTLRPFPMLSAIRPYLRICRRAAGAERDCLQHPHLLERRPPLFFDGAIADHLTYVDLSAAYFSIYTRTTLDVDYDGLSAPVDGRVRFLDTAGLGVHKLTRNALLGSLRRTKRRGLDHGKPFREPVPASARRPNLWGLVMDVLELVAWEMRDLGAVYVHTDGYIFAHKDLAEEAIDVLARRYHLRASIRAQGDGAVLGLGRWRIGEVTHGTVFEPGTRVDSMFETPPALASALRELLCRAGEV